jgi:cytidylate kinase
VSVPSLIVAVDGPAGAGKSAAARGLARRLDLPYLDTGAMYRAVGLAAARAGVPFPLDEDGVRRAVEVAEQARIEFLDGEPSQRVLLDGEDVTAELRRPEVSRWASMVSAVPGVRRAMVKRQRELAARSGGVVEGRDIGTVVFPGAPVKIFLTASPEVRARRRFAELERQGATARWEDVLAEQQERDRRDAERADSPMRPAAGAVVLDTSHLDLEEVVERLQALVRKILSPQ